MSMSAEPTNTTLGEYVAALVAELGRAHPSALARMRLVVGERRARIALGGEAVEVFFDAGGRLNVLPSADGDEADGSGETDSATVLMILAGELEVSAAVLGDRLRVRGADEDVARMFAAIEILLDAAPRTPPLQALADRLVREKGGGPYARPPGVPWYPFAPGPNETELLARLDLLPDE